MTSITNTEGMTEYESEATNKLKIFELVQQLNDGEFIASLTHSKHVFVQYDTDEINRIEWIIDRWNIKLCFKYTLTHQIHGRPNNVMIRMEVGNWCTYSEAGLTSDDMLVTCLQLKTEVEIKIKQKELSEIRFVEWPDQLLESSNKFGMEPNIRFHIDNGENIKCVTYILHIRSKYFLIRITPKIYSPLQEDPYIKYCIDCSSFDRKDECTHDYFETCTSESTGDVQKANDIEDKVFSLIGFDKTALETSGKIIRSHFQSIEHRVDIILQSLKPRPEI